MYTVLPPVSVLPVSILLQAESQGTLANRLPARRDLPWQNVREGFSPEVTSFSAWLSGLPGYGCCQVFLPEQFPLLQFLTAPLFL